LCWGRRRDVRKVRQLYNVSTHPHIACLLSTIFQLLHNMDLRGHAFSVCTFLISDIFLACKMLGFWKIGLVAIAGREIIRDEACNGRGIAIRSMDTLPAFSKPWLSTAYVSGTPASAPPLSLRGGVSASRDVCLVGFGSVGGWWDGGVTRDF
jgi:hypothetical protein